MGQKFFAIKRNERDFVASSMMIRKVISRKAFDLGEESWEDESEKSFD